jgi:GTP cyclohydrolase IA
MIVSEEQAIEAIRVLLSYIGEDPNRDGLEDTPVRVVRAWDEMTAGYQQNPADILARDFDAGRYDQVIACPWIEFHSTCEHHMLPFFGYAHIAYLPSKKAPRVVGLSKMARLVDCFARRLQIQEKMTIEISEAMRKHLKPQGVAVVIQAKHQCMACRGVGKQKAVMVTSSMEGVFREEGPIRSEFFQLVELASRSNG